MLLINIGLLFLLTNQIYGITSPYGWKLRQSLSGLWNFKTCPPNDTEQGLREAWFRYKLKGDILQMPVPSSYNDIGTDRNLRDYLGWAWYQTIEPVNISSWKNYRTVISFGGVHYFAVVYFGERLVGVHEGGHIPFEFELPENPKVGYITVAVNNTLNNFTIPQGFLVHHEASMSIPPYQSYNHDFDYFDYAGINRNVFLYATSKNVYIKDVFIQTSTNLSMQLGYVTYEVILESPRFSGEIDEVNCIVTLSNDTYIYKRSACKGRIEMKYPVLWWNAFSTHGPPGYLYSFTVELDGIGLGDGGNIYKTEVGIRDINWNNSTLLLNEQPVYLKGFGKHEDSDIRGRGFDWAVTLRDMELLKWTHANVIRTTHYPPSLELVDLANRMGLMLIVESPACSLSQFSSKMYDLHDSLMLSIFEAYGSNPSVIMWSLANEPLSNKPEAEKYFQNLVISMHSRDRRPVTYVTSQHPSNDTGAKYLDVICVNRYNGWYSFPGDLDHIDGGVTAEVMNWKSKYNVPFFITEYGAGSLSGLHNLPSSMWSEEYQTDLLKVHFLIFDKLKATGYLAGEMMWVFADFATPQEYIRPGGCVKGIFTRGRQPKKSAYTIRERYIHLDPINSTFIYINTPAKNIVTLI